MSNFENCPVLIAFPEVMRGRGRAWICTDSAISAASQKKEWRIDNFSSALDKLI